ncbi:hypothetical protein TNCV_2799711 [Trichonephila clavipes]|nr:hypothetical protein TNCV_2799711 [Trichonephila clavipes]
MNGPEILAYFYSNKLDLNMKQLQERYELVDRPALNWQWNTEDDVSGRDRHLLGMLVNDCTASSRQFATRWSSATAVLMSAS